MYFTLYKHPKRVLQAFGCFLQRWVRSIGLKLGVATACSMCIAPECTYWVLVGVLSSIGIGFGFHTGPLVLFPHITQVASQHSLTDTLSQVCVPTVCWGIGTALGEIPPFLMGPHLMRASQRIPSMNKIMRWSQSIVDRFGAVGIFALACWPNATFDACGAIAGVSEMPLWKFLGATILGKAAVKAPAQALFVILTTQGILQFGGATFAWTWFEYTKPVFQALAAIVVAAALYCTVESVGNIELENKERDNEEE